MTDADDAWRRFRDDIEELARSFRSEADMEDVKRAANAAIDSVNRVVNDPAVRDGTRRAARSFGDALAATLNQVAESLRSSSRRS
jgi:DNA-binding LacI/PurR family transcriptional regulator